MGRGRAAEEDRSKCALARRGLSHPALPLPARLRPPRAGTVRARARRSHARRPDHDPVSGRQGPSRASDGAVHARHLSERGCGHAHLAGARDNVRAVPVCGASRGDGAGATFAVMEGQASISADILARYAADAATEVAGVRGLVGRHGVKIAGENGSIRVELQLEVEWGAAIPDVGRAVQARVGEYLAHMADVDPTEVEVVVAQIGPAA